MSGSLRRFGSLTRLLQKQPDLADPINRIHPFLRNQTQTQTREYFRFPNVVRKVREYEIPSSLFTSSFSSSSSTTASFGKVGFVGWYLGMVKSWPVLTKSVTSSAIYIAADLSSQTISRSSADPYDLVRTSRMAGYGLLILGPSLHFWFNLMSKHFPKRDLVTTFKKMAMGQLIFGPFMTVVFFSLNARLQGESGEEIVSRLKRDLLPTMRNGVMYWPFCDFITFRFIPVHLQPLLPADGSATVDSMAFKIRLSKMGKSSDKNYSLTGIRSLFLQGMNQLGSHPHKMKHHFPAIVFLIQTKMTETGHENWIDRF
ncbi:hypothetical protein GQ457_18G016050 [Hibiscus cannabinus]